MRVLRRSLRDTIAGAGFAGSAARVYGSLESINPRIAVANVRYRRRGAPDQLPIPPADLRFLVSGTSDIGWFLEGGALAAQSIGAAAARTGAAMEELDAVLDFGCGCGRVLRHWRSLPVTRLCGTDYNPRLASWCRQHLPFAVVAVNGIAPNLDYGEEEFDLVYALSVFSHLTPDLQLPWVSELARILKPGGRLVVSTHGEAYLARLSASERKQFNMGQLVVKNNVRAPGTNTCSAYHPFAYVRDQFGRGLELVEFVPEGATGNPRQDLFVLRKPAAVARHTS